jgi:hypothetical protein
MYKSESTLGLIASILNAVITALLLIALIAVVLFSGSAEWFFDRFHASFHFPMHDIPLHEFMGMAAGFAALAIGILLVFSAASMVLGFIGVSQLNKENRDGGVLLLVASGLSLLSGGFVRMVLLLIGGVLALSKRPAVPPPPQS